MHQFSCMYAFTQIFFNKLAYGTCSKQNLEILPRLCFCKWQNQILSLARTGFSLSGLNLEMECGFYIDHTGSY